MLEYSNMVCLQSFTFSSCTRSFCQALRSQRAHPRLPTREYGYLVRFLSTYSVPKWDQRLFTLDPVSLAHILKHSTIYEKPWQSRALISSLIGVGMLAAEGQVHKRQRRVATPAFSIQNMRALVPVTFQKAVELKDRWMALIAEVQASPEREKWQGGARLDVCHWVSRATFDVIGLAGASAACSVCVDEHSTCCRLRLPVQRHPGRV